MLLDSIKTGDRVEISYSVMPKSMKPFHTTVEAVLKKKRLLLHAPISMGAIIRLPKEEQYILRFITEKGIYRFQARVIDYSKDDGFPLVSFQVTDNGERIQQRNFFRVQCTINTKFTVMQEIEDGCPPPQYDGVIRDMGGGGIKMLSKHSMEQGTMITVILNIENEMLLAFGEVVKTIFNQGASLPYQYGIKFTALSKTDQEKIIRYLTNEQRKLLSRMR
jgi:c-di-GMP-binding flagellar brake protein YcgR